MGAVKNHYFDEINAEPCANCGASVTADDINVEAFELSEEIMCPTCADGFLAFTAEIADDE